MSLLWRLLWGRAGHEDLPDELGPDPEPDEPEEAPPAPSFELTAADFQRAAAALGAEVATVRAVAEIEAAGRGFLPAPDNRPQILFEAHIFHRETNARWAGARDARGVLVSSPRWDRSLYGRAGAHQHDVRLAAAAALNTTAAQRSCSWGLFQVMGFNHSMVGWPNIAEFVAAMHAGAGPHLDAFVAFVLARNLGGALRARNWAAFARGYNGPGFAANQYDRRLADAYTRWTRADA